MNALNDFPVNLDLSLISNLSLLPSRELQLKTIKSIKDWLVKRYGEITKEWVMAELRTLARFHNKQYIVIHTDKKLLLDKVNALRESLGLDRLEKLDKTNLRHYFNKDLVKSYSYFDFDAYESTRNDTLHIW